MTTILDHALDMIRRGFAVFPIAAGSKDQPMVSHTNAAFTDPEALRAYYTNPVTGQLYDFNYGVVTTGRIVVDIDVNKVDKKTGEIVNGMYPFFALGGDLNTFVVRSPSGGLHCYYEGPDSAGVVGQLAPGIDVRSYHNYVLGPGSRTAAGEYRIEIDKPLAFVPEPIRVRLRPPRTRQAAGSLTIATEDTPAAVAAATAYLSGRAPVAIEGQGGDNTTYQVAAALVRDYGLTPETATSLMLELWNERCSPPWGLAELTAKVENAVQYATGGLGAKDPSVIFGTVDVPAPVYLSEQARQRGVFDFGNMPAENEVKRREWVMARYVLRKIVTLVGGPGAAGKSAKALAIGAHVAAGKDFLGMIVPAPQRVVIINAEDDRDEMSQRLRAVCIAYKLDFETVKRNMALVPGDEYEFLLTVGREATINAEALSTLLRVIQEHNVGFVCLDPLIEMHESEENDNAAMRKVMAVARFIARSGNCGVVANAHTPKGVYDPGNIDVIRGGGAIGAASRIAKTMFTASEEDALAYGFAAEDRKLYVRVDDAKGSMFKPSNEPIWMKKDAIRLANGESYPVLLPVDHVAMKRDANASLLRQACIYVSASGQGAVEFGAALEFLASQDVSFMSSDQRARKAAKELLRNRLHKAINVGVKIEGYGTLEIVYEQHGQTRSATHLRLS